MTIYNWPTRADYDLAMEKLTRNMLDIELRGGKLMTAMSGYLVQYGIPDANTCVYRIDNWMIRCFCRVKEKEPRPFIAERYQKLNKFFRDNGDRVSALVPLDFLEKGIKVDFYERDALNAAVRFIKEDTLPIVKMPYVGAASLGAFIAANHSNQLVMTRLSEAWMRMIGEMEAVHMAHGDLDLTNALVQEGETGEELSIKLIDYDNTWIPGFESYPLPEYGHEQFQHPSFFGKSTTFNGEIDRFSALVIYISIRLLAAFPQYYQTWQMSEGRLLFTPKDYVDEQRGNSERISRLRNLDIPGLQLYINDLSSSLRNKTMPRSLTHIATSVKDQGFTTQRPSEVVKTPEMYNPKYREIVITDWANIEYLPSAYQHQSAPQREKEHPQAELLAPVEPPPQNIVQPLHPRPEAILPQHEEERRIETLAPVHHIFTPPQQNQMHRQREEEMTPVQQKPVIAPPPVSQGQERIILPPYSGDTYDAKSDSAQTGFRGETPVRRSANDSLTTWIGCGIVLIALLVVILVIYLVIHAHSGSMLPPPPVNEISLHATSQIRAAVAFLTTSRGGSHVI
jgi:hypothetical protein